MSEPAIALERLDTLLGDLLRTISHDMRSPLLAISLSAELIEQGGTGVDDAVAALRAGAADLERMLAAVASLSRARRRELAVTEVATGDLLAAHAGTGRASALPSVSVNVDRAVIDELFALPEVADAPVEPRVEPQVEDGMLRFDIPLSASLLSSGGSPLDALAGSLQDYAGTPIEALAALEVVLVRQGASLRRVAERLEIALPLAP